MEAFADHPYTSPSEDSERDDESVDMNFEEFDGISSDEEEDDSRAESPLPGDFAADSFCDCGNCTDCSTKEAVCCRSKPEIMDLIPDGCRCVTETSIFTGLVKDGLDYTRFIHASVIRNHEKREEYLAKELTNGLKRNLLYRNFTIMVNKGVPLGKHTRVVIPRCVIEKIRVEYPEENGQYKGFVAVDEQ